MIVCYDDKLILVAVIINCILFSISEFKVEYKYQYYTIQSQQNNSVLKVIQSFT